MGIIRVLVVDDHTIVRYGIIELLAKAPDIEVVGNASDGPEALHLVETERPDVILLDIRMPQMGGVEVTRRLRTMNRDARVLALSASTEEEYINEMMAAGAAGYLTKDDELNEIAKAVRAVARGEVWVSPIVSAAQWRRGRQASSAPKQQSIREPLSTREEDVLRQVASGKRNQQIAQSLHITEATVKAHITHIFDKLGLETRTEAAVWAHQNGLIDRLTSERA